MDINRENYEIYFLDYAENNLSETQKREIIAFVRENPDLKEEFEMLSELAYIDTDNETVSFEQKNSLLKKESVEDYEITEAEFLCIAETEGDIKPEEKKRLAELLEEDEETVELYEKIKRARVKPDPNVIFPKDRIKRKTVYMRMKPLYYAAAASVVFWFGMQFFGSENARTGINSANFGGKQISVRTIGFEQNSTKPETESSSTAKTNKTYRTAFAENNSPNPDTETEIDEQKTETDDRHFTEPLFTRSNAPAIARTEIRTKDKERLHPVDMPHIKAENKTRFSLEQSIEDVKDPNKLWMVAEKGVNFFRKMTDSEFEMNNKYTEEGKIEELNFYASNFSVRKTFSK